MIDHQELLEEIKRLRTIGGYPEALILLRQAVESEPTDTKVRFWLAVVLAEIGEHKEAEEHARQVLRLDAGHRDAARLLERIQQWESKAALAATGQKQSTDFSRGFVVDETPAVKKKVCPVCNQSIDKSVFYCRQCGYTFKCRIAFYTFLIMAVSLSLLLGFRWWFWRFYGYALNPAVIVNNAGDRGGWIRIQDAEWNCAGMGLFQHYGRGYTSQVKGKLINTGNAPIQKASLTIHFTTLHGLESTYIYFDIYSWRPGQAIEFDFPLIYPPLKATGCEIRINEVVLEPDPTRELERTRVFVPRSDHFIDWIFRDAEGEIGAKRSEKHNWTIVFGQVVPIGPHSPARGAEGTPSGAGWLSFWAGLLWAFAINYVCLLSAVFLVNFCEEGKQWNEDWRLDAQACLWIVICFIVINALTHIIAAVLMMIPIVVMMAKGVGFLWKIYLFFLFFHRGTGMTVLLIVFYYCLSLSLQGLLKTITG